ncbi:hypothetical protein J1N35_039631 [Gossypium stocksii]|uniref:Uncharacterized protein n=1 Tax=Gossypium stocksii TaxID=47602 RepID=A0A9D3ZHU2_9ROSI|nr:hypothetical protein J1N35_039631 [Gossypium stocksii]
MELYQYERSKGRSYAASNKTTTTTNRLTIVNLRRSPTVKNKMGKILKHLRDYDGQVAVGECKCTTMEQEM